MIQGKSLKPSKPFLVGIGVGTKPDVPELGALRYQLERVSFAQHRAALRLVAVQVEQACLEKTKSKLSDRITKNFPWALNYPKLC